MLARARTLLGVATWGHDINAIAQTRVYVRALFL